MCDRDALRTQTTTPVPKYPTALPTTRNEPVPGYKTFIPKNPQPIASLLKDTEKFPQNKSVPKLFQPLKIRNVEFKHRIWAAPMCQYSADDGHMTDWHFVHIGSMATRGVEGIIMEATAVVPEGRISPEDVGLWKDSQIAPIKRIVDFVHSQGTKIGIQLAHAGRKASTIAMFVKGRDPKNTNESAHPLAGGWPDDVVGPSAIQFAEGYPFPSELTDEGIEKVKQAFVAAVRRCKEIGFDFIEIHGAHGYLLHSFVSPLSNHRTDKYGGSLDNRLRLSLELAEVVRKEWDGPLSYRVSASDWAEGEERGADGVWRYWGIEQTTILTQKLKAVGVDIIHVSSGGVYSKQKIPVAPSYQVHFAKHLKESVPDILVGAVGLITHAEQARDILENGEADIIFLARELLRDIDFVLKSAEELQVAVQPAVQYERAWTRMVRSIPDKK